MGESGIPLFEHCLLSASVSKAVGDFGYAKQVWQAAVRKNAGDKASAQQQKQPVKAAGTQDHSLLSASEQNRLTLAIFAARRYVERSEDTGGAGHHLLGLLLEQNAEYEEAADAYAAALERVAETSNSGRAWIARVHLGRALCSAGRCDEAADVYDRATELQVSVEIDSQQAFYATLGHSLALFFAERLEQSLGMFEQTLEKSEAVPALRPVVAVMLAQVLWALGSDEHRALARQHLLEVMADHTGLLPGLATLFGIGLLQGDGDLIAATYPELQKLRDQDPAHDVARIESYVALLREDPAGGRRALSKAVYRNPSDAQLWVLLAQFELRCGHNAKAMCAADSAISLFGQATRGQFSWSSAPSQAVSNSATLGVVVDASVVKTASLEQGRVARSAARRAVMYQPWVETTWNALATTT
ncbi:Superkiller protein 3 [Linderina macrospora]|uniref:Superkiller protein 3 n=1 Tax=Linderina macrospora TaxID=4868 RepID=A0ACC1JF52_9FUNG|nr:Superkiller protein 3 [Linderina macrospora]